MSTLGFAAPRPPSRDIDVRVPGDKSISHRALMCAAMADGTSTIQGLNQGADVGATRAVLAAVGVVCEDIDARAVSVRGAAALVDPSGVLDCGNSGSTMRMVAGVLAGRIDAVLDGDASLRKRPMERVARPLREMGADVTTDDGRPPVILRRTSAPLIGRRFALEVASAQVKSALLFAGLRAQGQTIVVEPAQTRDHTERMLAAMGAAIERRGLEVGVRPSTLHPLSRYAVPADFSSAFFFIAAAAASPGSLLRVRGVGVNPTRTAALDILSAMGARVRMEDERSEWGEPFADVVVEGGPPLHGVDIPPAAVPNLIDEVPALCALAAAAEGTTRIRGARELRAKESDRIATTAALARSFGATVEEYDDGLVVRGTRASIQAQRIDTSGDHRIGMAAALLGVLTKTAVTIDDAACIETSFPDFARVWRSAFIAG